VPFVTRSCGSRCSRKIGFAAGVFLGDMTMTRRAPVKHFLNECRSHLGALAASAAIGVTMLGIAYTAAPARVAVTAVARSPIAAAEAVAPAVVASHDGTARTTEPGWDLPNLDDERVDYWVSRFTTDRRDDFSVFLRRWQRTSR
jgi:hypothetical protein